MLYMDYNIPVDDIATPSALYDTIYEKSWFDDPEVIRIAETIDRVTHVEADIFESSVLGRIVSTELSGGVKTVILAYMGETNDCALPLSWLGENCLPVLGSLKIKHDVTFVADSVPMVWDWECRFISKRTGSVISDASSYREEMIKFVFNRDSKEA